MTATDDRLDRSVEITCSPGFGAWLERISGSLVFTVYEANRIVMAGRDGAGGVTTTSGMFLRSMGVGIYPNGRALMLAGKYQIVRFKNVLPMGELYEGSDALYVPQKVWVTGFLDVHDMIVRADGAPLFINTMFSCIATLSDGYNFKPLWHPYFISDVVAEDRCHLNGMATDRGVPRYVTALGETNTGIGWRAGQADSGVLVDVAANAPVLRGLSMPHSPRLYQGKLWLLESGRGHFGYVDLPSRRFVPVAFCPGFARGLTFAGPYAIIGLSLPRENKGRYDLPLDAALEERGEVGRCGIIVVNIETGETVEWLTPGGDMRELFDVAVLGGVLNPRMIDFEGDEIARIILTDTKP